MNGVPLRIAYFNQNKLHIEDKQFGDILDKAGDRPLAIISINGPMRSGKSYMINNFLKYLASNPGEDWFEKKLERSFHWQNSDERQTTGIMIWSEPFIIERNGREVAVLVMDTQGCFDDKTTTHENSLIFALSCLLSSTLIYNIKNQIQEDVLQFLQMFVGFAKMGQQSTEPFSKLVFLIRDWQSPRNFKYGYYDSHTSRGPRNYKREKLDTSPSMVPEVRIVHEEIVSSFLDVGCDLMPYPGNALACEDDEDNIDAVFRDTVKDFVPRIFDPSKIILKNIGGNELSGSYMRQLVERWAQYFATTELPEVKNVTEATAEVQNQIAFTIALKYYRQEMDKLKVGPGYLSQEDFESLHESNKKEAIAIFNRVQRLRFPAVEKRFQQSLEDSIGQDKMFYEQINSMKQNFCSLKEASEKEKNELRIEMHEKICQLEAARSSTLDSGVSKVCGLVLATIVSGVGSLIDVAATGDVPQALRRSGQLGCTVLRNFGWDID